MPNRRDFLLSAAAATATASVLPGSAWSADTLDLGDMSIATLSDGNLTLPADFITAPMPKKELAALQAARGVDKSAAYTPPCNVTLMRQGDNVVMFDTGAGPAFQDSAGKLVEAMDTAGIDVGDVTHVVFTHAHPDHIWGLLDDFDEPLFYNAQHMIGRAEFDYWMDPNTVSSIGQARASFAVGAQRRLEIVADTQVLFEDGEEVLPGVAARLTPGHTPGHMAFELRSGSQSAMVLGDCIGNDFVAFARPDWASGSDQDPESAAKTRVMLLDQLASEQMQIIGYHLPGGGIGRAERDGSYYRYVAA